MKTIYNLQEILWEFTLKCNKNCRYCGSKNILNKNGQEIVNRTYIAKEIAYAKPKEVTFTGGEPSVLMEELRECVKILYKHEIKSKILTNGNLFKSQLDKDFDKMVTCYGLSINELEDIDNAMKILSNIPTNKTTIITNFGIHNINNFDKILKFAMLFPTWQVQLTIGNEFQLDLDDIERLLNKLDEIPSNLLSVVKADNLNDIPCCAGKQGCSITYNGDVVPCLSYRSWKNDMLVQNNVFKKSLKSIWKEDFKFFRTRKFVPCCKSISGIEKIIKKDRQKSNDSNLDNERLQKELIPFEDKNKKPIMPNKVFVYGVVEPRYPNNTLMYGVVEPNNDWN